MDAHKKNHAIEREMDESAYDDMLDECYGDIEICGLRYSASCALKEVDPIAYRCGLSDQPLMFECPDCGALYEDEDEADDCCPLWICGECDREYDDEEEADDCCTEEPKEN